jgi:hypothetical protein
MGFRPAQPGGVLSPVAPVVPVPSVLRVRPFVRLPAVRSALRGADLMAMRDRRLLVVEEEFARVLGVARREGNTLSAVVRDAWGSGKLATMTRREPLRATGAHISIIGHTTRDEMLQRTADLELANGFVNRFLIVAARRSQLLPGGGKLRPSELDALSTTIGATLSEVRRFGRIDRTAEAEQEWDRIYRAMAEEDDGGMAAAATARGDAQTLRLSVAYALLDKSRHIGPEHLQAAYAVWCYCRDSARWLFGNSFGDPVADRVAQALAGSPTGLTRTDISNLFARHESSGRIEAAVELLEVRGFVKRVEEATGGRPREVIVPTASLCETSDVGEQSPPGEGLPRLDRITRKPLDEWPTLEGDALHGLAGQVIDVLAPHTESSHAALLLDFLASFGSAAGAAPHAFADGAEHPARLNVLIVGETARARKGTSRSNIARVMAAADPAWSAHRVLSGLASGEGLIAAVSDEDEENDR